MRKILSFSWLLIVLSAVPSFATDFTTALSEMFWNVPAGADVAGMGNAWVATPDFSSGNPALIGMGEEFRGSVTATYGQLSFTDGPVIRSSFVSATVALPVGVFQLSAGYSDSDKFHRLTLSEEGGTEETFKIEASQSVGFQYGIKAAEGLFVGFGYDYGESEAEMSAFMGTPATTEGFDIRSEGTSHSATAGAAYQPTDGLTLGASYTHAWERSDDVDSFNEYAERTHSSADQFRVGLGWQLLPLTFVAADYQYLNLDGVEKYQFFAGVEQGIVKDILYFYAGWAADAPTVGLGIYLEHGGLNAGYVYHGNDDLEEFWGQSSTWVASGYLSF